MIPELNKKFLIITNRKNQALNAVISTYLGESGCYLPTFAYPFVSASITGQSAVDPWSIHYLSTSRAEVFSASINNIQAQLGVHETVILAGLTEEQRSFLRFPSNQNIIEINDIEEMPFSLAGFAFDKKGEVFCASDDVLAGQFVALKNNRVLKIDDSAKKIEITCDSKILVVIEDNHSVDSSIAINYAFSVHAEIIVAEGLAKKEDKEIMNLIQEASVGYKASVDELSQKINKRLGTVNLENYDFVTFFTDGIPYTMILGNSVPCSYVHLSQYPGHFVMNNLIAEKVKQFGSTIIFSPEHFDTDEIKIISKLIEEKNIIVNSFLNKEATVRNLGNSLENFPFDMYHIASHGGQIKGARFEKEFIDHNGAPHNVIFDRLLSFAPGGENNKIAVEVMIYPRVLDGKSFHSEELNAMKYDHEVFTYMYKEIYEGKKDDEKLIEKDIIIPDSNAIKCVDFNFFATLNYLGADGLPFIFNNSCWSGLKVAEEFINQGARGYIGTLWAVGNKEAVATAELFYQYAFDMPIVKAINLGMRQTEGTSSENIYIYWGLHFSSLQNPPPNQDVRLSIYKELIKREEIWKRKLNTKLTEKQAESISNYIKWLNEEISRLYTKSEQQYYTQQLMKRYLNSLKPH